MTDQKPCTMCGHVLPCSSFYRDQKRKDGLQIYCKTCKNERQRDWYRRNQRTQATKKNVQRNARRLASRRRLYTLLLASACIECGEAHPACLDFDHVRGEKRYTVNDMIARCYSWQEIAREIAKCEVRCANCHRKKTAEEQQWYSTVMEPRTRNQ